jgi:two-component system, sensor histidine kinase and response regulator
MLNDKTALAPQSEASQDDLRPRVLIVDDESTQVVALCRTLGAEGYATTGTASANEALSLLRSAADNPATAFDILMTDLQMPEMNGISLLRAAHEVDRILMGIVMTGHGTIDTAVDAMKSGALDYIVKPFKLKAVIPVLTRAISLRRLRLENAALSERVAERSAALEAANRHLQVANKELEAFTFSISHDLRQPLSAMIGFSEYLIMQKAGPLNAEQQDCLCDIRDSGRRLVELTEDLLRFSRVSHQSLSKQEVSVATLVNEVIRGLRDVEPDRAVDFRVAKLPQVQADPVLLRQVFANLLSNAFKFTRHTSNALIEVTGDRQGAEYVFSVRDNGAGFDMANAQRLFAIFHRLHTSEQFEGTGVGLSIVQRIIERHGGKISAEGSVGEGACFTFTLAA